MSMMTENTEFFYHSSNYPRKINKSHFFPPLPFFGNAGFIWEMARRTSELFSSMTDPGENGSNYRIRTPFVTSWAELPSQKGWKIQPLVWEPPTGHQRGNFATKNYILYLLDISKKLKRFCISELFFLSRPLKPKWYRHLLQDFLLQSLLLVNSAHCLISNTFPTCHINITVSLMVKHCSEFLCVESPDQTCSPYEKKIH